MCMDWQSYTIKTKRKIIAFIYHSGVISISLIGIKAGTAFNSPGLLNISAIVLLAHLLTFRIIPILRWIQERLIREATCYGCGAMIALDGLFRCSCGYMSHRERHVFSHCPMCSKYYRWITCPACETSIPI